MKRKNTQFSGRIRDYVSDVLKASVGSDSDKLLLYADGLVTMKRKGVKAMIRDLNGGFHTSTISRTLIKAQPMLESFKRDRNERDIKFDKRKSYSMILDDTAVRRYGRNIYGCGYNYDSSVGGTIWSNCLVTFVLTEKKGDRF